ncbi:MAG: hypothetical protein HKM93_11615 [Desulfobacteraceae bacterium]|nr:hypothetical protein [Desulfobacteraceae bacterium]
MSDKKTDSEQEPEILVVKKKKPEDSANRQIMDTQETAQQKKDIEHRISTTVCTKILPLIDSLRQIGITEEKCDLLEKAAQELTTLTGADTGGLRSIYLTDVESRIGTLLDSGYTTEEIARTLNIQVETVYRHQQSLKKKLNLIDRRTPDEEFRFTLN